MRRRPFALRVRLVDGRRVGHVGLDAHVVVVIHRLLVDVVVVSLEVVGELVRVAHHILPQVLGRGRRSAAMAAVGIAAILRILLRLRLLVAVDVSDAGDRLQPRGDSSRTANGVQVHPSADMNGGQSRHRRPTRQ